MWNSSFSNSSSIEVSKDEEEELEPKNQVRRKKNRERDLENADLKKKKQRLGERKSEEVERFEKQRKNLQKQMRSAKEEGEESRMVEIEFYVDSTWIIFVCQLKNLSIYFHIVLQTSPLTKLLKI